LNPLFIGLKKAVGCATIQFISGQISLEQGAFGSIVRL